jgi:hypothetical protein
MALAATAKKCARPYFDMEHEQITTRRIGRVMGTIRFGKSPSSQPIWLVTSGVVVRGR